MTTPTDRPSPAAPPPVGGSIPTTSGDLAAPAMTSAVAAPEAERTASTPPRPVGRTRAGSAWTGLIGAGVVLLLLLIFILQNLQNVTVHFLGLSGQLPLAVGLLLAAVASLLLAGLVGTARIVQLRLHARKNRGAAAG